MSKTAAHEALWAKAVKAGEAAADACTPTPMYVGTAKAVIGPGSNDIDPAKPVYYVPQGICGFASVRFKGNTGFGRWAKSSGRASKSYMGGLRFSVSGYGQSYERKSAFAAAFTAALIEGGVSDAYYESRLD